ncbi:MAG: cupin domain-containing protein [Alphaproteobacteria bacterium]|nr:MAG: cupin domain-containing protein [Alphaproteobacteria bacterium]
MPKLDLTAIPSTNRTTYPEPYAAGMTKRSFRRLGAAGGLTDFGISHVTVEPGGMSSQRHWHSDVDEFLVMLEGEAVLVEEGGETMLRPGDCAAFPKGAANGHHIVNRSAEPCVFLAFGRSEGDCHYPDADLHWDSANNCYTRKDGTPYAAGVS